MEKFYGRNLYYVCLTFVSLLLTSPCYLLQAEELKENQSLQTINDQELTFAFLYTYPVLDDLTFTGIVVTPSQSMYETPILSCATIETSLTLPAPIERGVYTIAFNLKHLPVEFEVTELGRLTVVKKGQQDSIVYIANLEDYYVSGQQMIFHYVVAP